MELEILAGNLACVQANVYNGLSGFYSPGDLLKECGGDVVEAARQIVDGALSAGMIETADALWDGPDGIRRPVDCYTLVEGYLEGV